MYSLFLYIFAVHVSGAICAHPQEHNLQSTAIGMLIHWTESELDRAKSMRVSQPVPAPGVVPSDVVRVPPEDGNVMPKHVGDTIHN
jgi:hypothetical protein